MPFIPGAGSNSKRVITGPGWTATTFTSTPKSFNFNSTCLDIASSVSFEYCPIKVAGSSNRFNGGRTVSTAGSNKFSCFSIIERILGFKSEIIGSILSGSRCSTMSCSILKTVPRSLRARRPSIKSLSEDRLLRNLVIIFKANFPIESITKSQERPAYRVNPIINSASIINVLPSKPVNFNNTGPTV